MPVVVCFPGGSYFDAQPRLAGRRTRGRDDAALSIEVQLYAGDLDQADRQPRGPRTAAQSYIESVGGKLHGFWYAFGEHDGYTLWEGPDNVSMAAVALAISG